MIIITTTKEKILEVDPEVFIFPELGQPHTHMELRAAVPPPTQGEELNVLWYHNMHTEFTTILSLFSADIVRDFVASRGSFILLQNYHEIT